MSTATIARVQELLAASLRAWHLSGGVTQEPDGALLLRAGEEQFRITRAPPDLPFRWLVTQGERTRGITSVAGLLRTVRAAADPDYRPIRLRIAPLPVAPP